MSAPYVPRAVLACSHCGRIFSSQQALSEHVYYAHACTVVGHRATDVLTGECTTCRAARRAERRAGRVREVAG